MAGVIAGDDPATGYRGIAPGARLVSVKVAGADGLTSLVRVLMALDWVRRHRDADGLHIRVVNLSLRRRREALLRARAARLRRRAALEPRHLGRRRRRQQGRRAPAASTCPPPTRS